VTLEAETHAPSAPGPAGQVGDLPRADGGSAEAQTARAGTAEGAQTTTITAVLVSYDENPQQLRYSGEILMEQPLEPADRLII
jgi:hypothetical protein